MSIDFSERRFIVTALWPGTGYRLGQIVYYSMWGGDDFPAYPLLFKELKWWQHRTLEELCSIQYAKVIEYVGYNLVGDIVPVRELIYKQGRIPGFMLGSNLHPFDKVVPSSLEEYNTFTKQNSL